MAHHSLVYLLAASFFLQSISAQLPPNINVEDLLRDSLFDGQKKDHICPTSSCPSGYTPIAKWPLKIESTGCAALGSMAGVPASGSGMDYTHIEDCCHTRNACYQLCGSDKQRCDKIFESCMEESCGKLKLSDDKNNNDDDMFPGDMFDEEDENDGDDTENTENTEYVECNKSKEFMVLLRQMAGCGAYDAYQTMHCQCVAKDKVAESMERVLRAFYKEYNPEGIDKVKSLVEKAKGKKRAVFNKILMSLVNKYPEAITKKEPEYSDPVKEDL